MNEAIPKWARLAIGGLCSICGAKETFYSEVGTTKENVEFCNGAKITQFKMFPKIYCKECFEEYGGAV